MFCGVHSVTDKRSSSPFWFVFPMYNHIFQSLADRRRASTLGVVPTHLRRNTQKTMRRPTRRLHVDTCKSKYVPSGPISILELENGPPALSSLVYAQCRVNHSEPCSYIFALGHHLSLCYRRHTTPPALHLSHKSTSLTRIVTRGLPNRNRNVRTFAAMRMHV